MSRFIQEGQPFSTFGPGPDGELFTSDDVFDEVFILTDNDTSTLGLFLEPRFVFTVFWDRVGLYFLSGVAVSRISLNQSGTREVLEPGFSDVSQSGTGSLESFSFEATRISLTAYGGPGLLIRLTSRVNLDLAGILGLSLWGEPNPRVEPDYPRVNANGNGSTVGGRVGLVIGIG